MDAAEQKIRVFAGLKTPVKWDEELQAVQKRLAERIGSNGIRWVKAEQIHITLRFFGHILIRDAADVAKILASVAVQCAPMTLRCEGIGCFPSARRPKVIWAGLKGDIERVAELQSAIAEASAEIGEPPDHRPFKPHLTLARVRELRPSKARLLEDAGEELRIEAPWNVHELLLMRSHLSPEGSRYETIGSWRLEGKVL